MSSSDREAMYQQAQPLMLSSPNLSDESFPNEKDALSPPAYERDVIERKRKHKYLIGSLVANAVLTLSLAWLWGTYHNRFAWRGVQPVWSESDDSHPLWSTVKLICTLFLQPHSMTKSLMNMSGFPTSTIPPSIIRLRHPTDPAKNGKKSTKTGRTFTNVSYRRVDNTLHHAAHTTNYQGGISAIPKSGAAQLERKTIQYADDPGMYVVELDVFHQLHCLNTLRKKLYPEIYPKNNATVSCLLLAPGSY